MASVGPQSPTAAASNNQIGGTAQWLNPSNVYASDNSKTVASLSGPNSQSCDLDVTGFDFSAIPSGSTIDGIVVEIEKFVSTTATSPRDKTIQLLIGSAAAGANKATGTTWPTSDTYITYGSSVDKWSLTPSHSDITGAGFGVRVRTQRSAGKGGPETYVDHVRITVYYTAGGGGGTVSSNSVATIPMAIFAM